MARAMAMRRIMRNPRRQFPAHAHRVRGRGGHCAPPPQRSSPPHDHARPLPRPRLADERHRGEAVVARLGGRGGRGAAPEGHPLHLRPLGDARPGRHRRRARRRPSTISAAFRRRCSPCSTPRPARRRWPRASPRCWRPQPSARPTTGASTTAPGACSAACIPTPTSPSCSSASTAASTPPGHFDVGAQLAAPARRGRAVIGSGDIVHNLRAADFRDPAPLDWALRFRDRANALIAAGDDERPRPLRAPGPRRGPRHQQRRTLPAAALRPRLEAPRRDHPHLQRRRRLGHLDDEPGDRLTCQADAVSSAGAKRRPGTHARRRRRTGR